MNFTWDALEAAQTAYKKLIREFKSWDRNGIPSQEHLELFNAAINDDLNTPKALAVIWELVKAPIDSKIKAATLEDIDGVLGLGILEKELEEEKIEIPQDVLNFAKERDGFRKAGDYAASDEIRKKIQTLGYDIKDTKSGFEVIKK